MFRYALATLLSVSQFLSALSYTDRPYVPVLASQRMHIRLAVEENPPVVDQVATNGDGVSMPINSAGEHTGTRKAVDVILLFIALSVPIWIFFCIKLYEYWLLRREQREQLEADESGTNKTTTIARTGSNYNLPTDANRLNIVGAMHPLSPDASEGTILQNVLAGFSTAMAALPDAISFSFITGVSPLNGIWAGVFMGLSAALVGGRPGMISSASAATAVVLAEISTDPHMGMAPMALCVFIVGVLQALAGALRLSRFITLIPHPVMLGFVNGLAIVMIRAQMRQFHHHGDGPWVEGPLILSMTITALVAIAAAMIWARIPYANKILPPPLASVIITVVFSIIFKHILRPRTLKMVAGAHTFRGGVVVMPSWDFPPVGCNWHSGHMWGRCIATAVRFAIVGLLESFMTAALIDQITKTTGSMRRECFGQALGNILSSLFGTQGGCALIAQSLLNVSSGGRSRVSGAVMALTLFLSVVALAPLIGLIPVAALVGLIVLIALNTFAWGSLQLIWRVGWIDSIVIVVVTVVTVWKDLATAVVVGVIINALGFAWTAATHVQLRSEQTGDDEVTLFLTGPLFFGSAMNFQTAVTKIDFPETHVILDFTGSKVLDISGSDAINKAHEFLTSTGKQVTIRGVPSRVLKEANKNTAAGDAVEKGDQSARDSARDSVPSA